MGDHRRSNRNEEKETDYPVHSRLFLVCDKSTKKEDLEDAFSEFGDIEAIKIPRDHKTGEQKGVAYIKFYKTSHAAAALEEMHAKILPNTRKPLKVMVAASKSGIRGDYDSEHFKRLFVTVPKVATEEEITDYFQEFGQVISVLIQRDRNTGESKGFAYVTFKQFSEAAIAFEEADKKYRAIFAQPKGERRFESTFESNLNALATKSTMSTNILSMVNTQPQGYTCVSAIVSPHLTQQDVEHLFDIVPGMVNCQYIMDLMREYAKVFVIYSNPISAAYAVEKLNNFNYPPGQKMFVKPDFFNKGVYPEIKREIPNAMRNLTNAINTANTSIPDLAQLIDAVAQASNIIKTAAGVAEKQLPDSSDLNYCSVTLPPPKPLANINSSIAKRCFLVCQPQPPPLTVLRDIFCRFGDLINVYTIPSKTVGYACYATATAADSARQTLHGAEVCGVRMKVLEAEEKRRPSNNYDDDDDYYNTSNKKMKHN